MKKLLMTVFLCISFSFSQESNIIIPVANDPTLHEIDPYLTKFWYDGYFKPYLYKTNAKDEYPIWLIYIEIDSSCNQRVVAKNIGFEWEDIIKISEKYIIYETDSSAILTNPIIENYLGKPVALWTEILNDENKILSSVLMDSIWSNLHAFPIDSPIDDYVYYTVDEFRLKDQYSFENYLIWASDEYIYQSYLDSNYVWSNPSIICAVDSSVISMDIRMNINGDIWLIYTEKLPMDSSQINLLVLKNDESKWQDPFYLVNMDSKDVQSGINLADYYREDYPMVLSWLENDCFHEMIVTYKDDSVYLSTTDNDFSVFSGESVIYNTNNLLYGGCIVGPSPYYFSAVRSDLVYYLNVSQYNFASYDIHFYSTVNQVSNLTISGFNTSYFATAWVENDQLQSDIYLFVGYISIGLPVEDKSNIPLLEELYNNCPNPFNPVTTISYYIPSNQIIEINLYDILGRKIRNLYKGYQTTGYHEFEINGRDLASGVYVYTLNTKDAILTKKCTLLK